MYVFNTSNANTKSMSNWNYLFDMFHIPRINRIQQRILTRNYMGFNTVRWSKNILILVSQRNYSEDGQMSGRNMSVTITQWKYINKIKVHLLVFKTFYAWNFLLQYTQNTDTSFSATLVACLTVLSGLLPNCKVGPTLNSSSIRHVTRTITSLISSVLIFSGLMRLRE